jgi:hypothetical protein
VYRRLFFVILHHVCTPEAQQVGQNQCSIHTQTGRQEQSVAKFWNRTHRTGTCSTGRARPRFYSPEGGFLWRTVEDRDEHFLIDFIETFSNEQIRVIGPELIFGSLYDKIGFNAIKKELFRHPAVSRLFSPGSKLKTIDCLERYQGVKYSID